MGVGADGHPSNVLYVQRAQTKAERELAFQNNVELFVQNLDGKYGNCCLRKLFAPFGTVVSASVATDERGRCKGFGFVTFASSGAANRAVTELHQKSMKGMPLQVSLASRRNSTRQLTSQQSTPEVRPSCSPASFGNACAPMVLMGVAAGPVTMISERSAPTMLTPAPVPAGSQVEPDISTLSGPEFAGALAIADPRVQKQMLGERLFWRVAEYQPTLAPKITGMMLEHDNSELLNLLDSEWHLKRRIDEAVH